VRIVAGEIGGHLGPGSTHTPITMAHATIQPGAQLSLPWQPDYNALVYVLSGNGTVGAEQRPIRGGQLAVFGAGDRVTIAADKGQDSNRPAGSDAGRDQEKSPSRWRVCPLPPRTFGFASRRLKLVLCPEGKSSKIDAS